MNRSDFFYDQEVREQEMDQVFDDVEDMEQNKIVDFDIWGVIIGLETTQQTTPDLTVKVSAGIGHDHNGNRIIADSVEDVNLASYLPTTGATYFKYVDIYGVDFMDESDPRLDGHSNPVNYRLTEGIDFLIVEGTESTGTPPVPTEDTDNLPLNRVLLEYGQTQIIDANISAGYRTGAEIVWRKDRSVINDLDFAYTPSTQEYTINNPTQINLAANVSIGDAGIDANGRSIENIGQMSMISSGLGFDLNDNSMTEVNQISFNSGSGVGIDLEGKQIGEVSKIIFTADTIDSLLLDGRNILMGTSPNGGDLKMAGGSINDIGLMNFLAGSGSGLDTNGKDITTDNGAISCGTLALTIGTGTGIETKGKNVDLSAGEVTCSIIRFDSTISNKAFFGPSSAQFNDQYYRYYPGDIIGIGFVTPFVVAGTTHIIVPLNLPTLCSITAVEAKVKVDGTNEWEMSVMSQNWNMGTSTTAPSNRALVTGAATRVTSTSALGYATLAETFGGTPYQLFSSRFHCVVLGTTGGTADMRFYGLEVSYEMDFTRGNIQ